MYSIENTKNNIFYSIFSVFLTKIKQPDANRPEKAIPIVKLDINMGFIFLMY